jgi:Reverse transcriptase (RNA-dependent DNA polymerase)/Endonuclease-reverse transcriptase
MSMATKDNSSKLKRSFSVCHLNTRSLLATSEGGPSRFDLFSNLVTKDYDFDIIALSETHLDSNVDLQNIWLDGYQLFRKDRNRAGGGVAVYAKADLFPVLFFETTQFNIESLFIKVVIGNIKAIIGVCYRPPNQSSIDKDVFLENLDDQLNIACKSTGANTVRILLGDFNDKCHDWNSNHKDSELGMSLVNLFQQYELQQVIKDPTRGVNLLDLLATDRPDLLSSSGIISPIDNLDHCAVYGCFETAHHVKKHCYTRNIRNYSPEGLNELNHNLSDVPWNALLPISESVDDCVYVFYNVLNDELNKVIPLQLVTIRPRDKPGMNSQIRKLFSNVHRLHSVAKLSGSAVDIQKHREARSFAKKQWRTARKVYYSKLGANLSNSKKYWKSVRSIYGNSAESSICSLITNSSENRVVTDVSEISELLNECFASISRFESSEEPEVPQDISFITDCRLSECYLDKQIIFDILRNLDPDKAVGPDGIGNLILSKCASSLCEPMYIIFRRSMESGVFPSMWKLSNVVPIFKQGDRQSPNNYRPVSLLCSMSKVFEKVVYNCLYDYCTVNKLLSVRNSGFKKGDGTINRLLYITENIHQALDSGNEVGMVFLDISKAFDKVWHKGLLYKLSTFGVSGTLFNWLANYLENRKQRVVLSGKTSSILETNAGVPQGSILGPLLFLIFINDIEEGIISDMSLFADDCTLAKVYSEANVAESCLNQDLIQISNWATKWLVKFNYTKTVAMIFSNKLCKSSLNLNFNGVISMSHEHKHLGLLFSDDLKWSKHIKSCVSSAYRKLGLLFRLRSYLTRQQMESVYISVIRPALEYGSVIYDNCTLGDSFLLESVQRKAAITCTGALRRTSTVTLMNELAWESLSLRRRVSKLVWFYKLFCNRSPEYLTVFIRPRDMPARTTRSVVHNAHCLKEYQCRTTKYFKAFFPECTRTWNSLKDSMFVNLVPHQFKVNLTKLWSSRVQSSSNINVFFRSASVGMCKLLTQFRLGLSPLNYDLFQFNIIDNPFCPTCGDNFETLNHYFLECTGYKEARSSLLGEITALVKRNNIFTDDQPFTSNDLLCFVTKGFFLNSSTAYGRDDPNKLLFETVSRYVAKTNRFCNEKFFV